MKCDILYFLEKKIKWRERETYEVKIIVPEGRIEKSDYLLATIKSGCCLFTLLAFSRGQRPCVICFLHLYKHLARS